jgi:predicted ATPase
MITYLKINGFKSFQNFEMIFTPLTVIAGANASGKSNLFDALKLLSCLATMDLKDAFNKQRGNPGELFTQYTENSYASEMEFTVEMLVGREVKDNWGITAKLNSTRLRYRLIIVRKHNTLGIDDLVVKLEHLEKIKTEDDEWSKEVLPKDARVLSKTERAGGSKEPFIQTVDQNGISTIQLRQDGKQGNKRTTPASAITQTILGGVTKADFPHAFAAREEMRSWKFLQLNPEDLREPTRQDPGLSDVVTQSGKNLAAALYRIRQDDEYHLKEVSRELGNFLPNFTEVNVYDDKADRQFIIKVKEGGDGQEFSSRVLSEGTLRLLALCILEYDAKHTGLLCFEEPENGIHPFRITMMAHLLKNLSVDFLTPNMALRQVIVNTHSPVLISELIRWEYDRNVSIWLSRLHTLITEVGDQKLKLKITKMSPVGKPFQLSLFPISEQERKITIAEVIQYLGTPQSEYAIKVIQS